MPTAPALGPALMLELNGAQPSDKGCRLTFVVTNNLGAELSKAAFEIALFNEAGVVDRLTVLDFNELPAGKTKVARFDLAGTDCAKVSRVLVNHATECTGSGIDPTSLHSPTQAGDQVRHRFRHVKPWQQRWSQSLRRGGQFGRSAGMALAALEPDDPDLAIPSGSLEIGMREASERTYFLDQSARLADTPLEPLGAVSKAAGPAERKRKWTVALVASCVFHAAVAMVFIPMSSDKVLIEGADASGIAFLGNAPEDQVSAGDIAEKDDPAVTNVTMITMLDAKPVATVDAQAVPVEETVEAVDRVEAETTAAESLQPVEDLPAELETTAETVTATPPDRADPVVDDAPSTVAAAEIVPEILAVDTLKPAENDDAVQRLAETVEAAPVETAETVAALPEPVEEVSEAKPVQKKPPQPKKQWKRPKASRGRRKPSRRQRRRRKSLRRKKKRRPSRVQGARIRSMRGVGRPTGKPMEKPPPKARVARTPQRATPPFRTIPERSSRSSGGRCVIRQRQSGRNCAARCR